MVMKFYEGTNSTGDICYKIPRAPKTPSIQDKRTLTIQKK